MACSIYSDHAMAEKNAIEKYDFLNSSYIIKDCGLNNNTEFLFPDPLKLINGGYTNKSPQSGEVIEAKLDNVKYIDLDNDGETESVVELSVKALMDIGGGKEYFVFKNIDQKITQIFQTETIRGGHLILNKEKGTINIIYPDYSQSDAICCPSLTTTDTYELRGDYIILRNRTSLKH